MMIKKSNTVTIGAVATLLLLLLLQLSHTSGGVMMISMINVAHASDSASPISTLDVPGSLVDGGLTADVQLLADLKAGWGLCAGRSDAACGGASGTSSDTNSLLMTLQFSSSSPASSWGGVGFAETGMVGNAVVCGVIDANITQPICILLKTVNYGVELLRAVTTGMEPITSDNMLTFAIHDISINATTSMTSITFRIDRSLIGADLNTQRFIFSVGVYDATDMLNLWSTITATPQTASSTNVTTYPTNPLSQHTDRGTALIGLSRPGELMNMKVDSYYVIRVAAVIIMILAAIAFTTQFMFHVLGYSFVGAGPIANPRVHALIAFILLVILPIAVLLIMREHYILNKRSAPWFRALGDIAKYGFFLVLLPVCHRVSIPAFVFRTSYERSINMHAATGILILLAVTAHGVGMSFKAVKTFSDILRPDTPHRNLYGVLAWVTLVLVAIPAILRGKKNIPRIFATFRTTHFLVVLVVIFGVIHSPTLAVVMVPGLLLYTGDILWRAFIVFYRNRRSFITTKSAYNAAAGVTAVQIKYGAVIASSSSSSSATSTGDNEDVAKKEAFLRTAGKHVLVRIARLGLLPHPISIALTDPTRGTITLFVKNTGHHNNNQPSSSSHKWTERLASIVMNSAQNLLSSEEGEFENNTDGDSGKYNKKMSGGGGGNQQQPVKLFDAAVLDLVNSNAVVSLEGLLGHNINTSSTTVASHVHIVLMAGGIGITPVLSYLQALAGLATNYNTSSGAGDMSMHALREISITVVWSVRENGMRAYFEPLLIHLANAIINGSTPSSTSTTTAAATLLSVPKSCSPKSCCGLGTSTPSSNNIKSNNCPALSSATTLPLAVKSVSLHIFQTGSSSSSIPKISTISSSPFPTLKDTTTADDLEVPMMARTTTTTATNNNDDDDDILLGPGRHDGNEIIILDDDDEGRGDGHEENLSDFDDDINHHQNHHHQRHGNNKKSSTSKRRESDIEMMDLITADNGDGEDGDTVGKHTHQGAARTNALWYLPHQQHVAATPTITTTSHKGRPSLNALAQLVSEEGCGGGTCDKVGAVYACGPPGVMGMGKELAIHTGLLFNYEVFE